MSYQTKIVSTNEVFPIIREFLVSNQKVKFTVSGNSMLPWIANDRDQVLVTTTEGKNLKSGDIVLFQMNGRYILHRIYKNTAGGYHTIGDACLNEDGIVKPSDIIGVVEKIYRKGKVINCTSFFWKHVFGAWIKLLPFRKYLLILYSYLSRLKSGIRNRLHFDSK